MKVNAIRVDMEQDQLKITAVGQSPRGTKIRLRQAVAKGRKGDKKAFRENILKAIEEVVQHK